MFQNKIKQLQITNLRQIYKTGKRGPRLPSCVRAFQGVVSGKTVPALLQKRCERYGQKTNKNKKNIKGDALGSR